MERGLGAPKGLKKVFLPRFQFGHAPEIFKNQPQPLTAVLVFVSRFPALQNRTPYNKTGL